MKTEYARLNDLHPHSPDCRGECVPVMRVPEGMPDFEPGDRVRTKASPTDVFGSPVAWHEYEIAHIYFDGERWCFYSTEGTRHPLAKYTKLPRKKTVTIVVPRVAEGSKIAREIEETVEGWQDLYGISIDILERVEDPDE